MCKCIQGQYALIKIFRSSLLICSGTNVYLDKTLPTRQNFTNSPTLLQRMMTMQTELKNLVNLKRQCHETPPPKFLLKLIHLSVTQNIKKFCLSKEPDVFSSSVAMFLCIPFYLTIPFTRGHDTVSFKVLKEQCYKHYNCTRGVTSTWRGCGVHTAQYTPQRKYIRVAHDCTQSLLCGW